jgi:hypothetical protein
LLVYLQPTYYPIRWKSWDVCEAGKPRRVAESTLGDYAFSTRAELSTTVTAMPGFFVAAANKCCASA